MSSKAKITPFIRTLVTEVFSDKRFLKAKCALCIRNLLFSISCESNKSIPALAATTNTSSKEYQELIATGTDPGRRQHLASRASTSTILTIAAGVNIVNKLPDIVLEVSVKLAKGKKILKFTKLDGLPTDVVENFRDKVKGLEEKAEQFLEDFRDASQDQLRKIVELDLVDSWKVLSNGRLLYEISTISML